MSELLFDDRAALRAPVPAHDAAHSDTPASAATSGARNLRAPRRVLYVVSLFPSWSETFIVREIRALVDSGVDVRILSLRHPADGPVHADAAALAHRVRHPQSPPVALWKLAGALLRHPRRIAGDALVVAREMWRTPVVLLKSLLAMARGLEHLAQVRDFDPEFIHAHWSTYPSTAAWSLARALGLPFGFTCHAHDIFVNRHMLPRKIADADLAVTISRHNIDWMARNVCASAPRRLKVVHCGVDLRDIEWRPGPRDPLRIVGVGRLAPEKGFATLVEALARLRDEGRDFECELIGEGPFRARLEALVARHGLGARVRLRGAQPQEAVRAAIGEAAVFVLPCEVAANGSRDGIPVALMEAMAAGCPVVSCPVSGVPELIEDGAHGLLVPERDAAALARALARLLDDPALRTRLATAARQRIESGFDARKEALKLHHLMTEAVAHAA